ncbi:hypothetical protein PHJA_001762800 [Phtheirospermum japonicum]|uniref:F-box domain-containing protein n=1 Tax=Phtheirospermum japonicum TaxID=374723 RepID=A0A830C654_9LAMI|nr:hypothetical protein PHJA_001762800 [Phtheirospermum japonicum]
MAAGEEVDCRAAEGAKDPVVVFCDGVMTIILGKLDVRSIARARVVSSDWMALASADKLWGPKVLFLF